MANMTKVGLLEKLQAAQKRIAELESVIFPRHKDSAHPELDDKFSILFEPMSLDAVYHDAHGIIVDANPAAENILGPTQSQLQGRASIDPRWKSIHEDGSEFWVKHIWQRSLCRPGNL